MKPSPRTKARIQAVKNMLNDGMTAAQIARYLGITRQSVSQLIYYEKFSARQAVYKAVKSGKVTRPKFCVVCNYEGLIHAHHDDYSRPLYIVWLCEPCHVARHTNKLLDPEPNELVIESKYKKRVHGTVNRYVNYGCRCSLCRKASSDYFKKYNKKSPKV